MAGMGAGYDLSVSTFSPDGRVFQVEYASKAVDNSGTSVALVCKDGVILGVEKFVLNKMNLEGTNRRIYMVDKHISVAISGLIPDARQVIQRARSEAESYRRTFGESIPPYVLAERVGLFVHAYTLYWSVRPFGAAILIGAVDTDAANINTSDNNDNKSAQGELYCVEPSGTCYKYFGTSIGKGRQSAKTELEKLNPKEMSCQDALFHIVKILKSVHDDSSKDKQLENEIAWICPKTNYKFDFVPKELIKQMEEKVDKFLADAEDTDMES